METITNLEKLTAAIEHLENKQKEDWILLREQVSETYTNLKPINLIKNSFKEMVSSSDFQSNAINTAIGISSGYLAKKIIVGETDHPLPKLLGNVLELVVSTKAFNNADKIKSFGNLLLSKLLKKSTAEKTESEE